MSTRSVAHPILVRGMVACALAVSLEFAVRSSVPVPYAPRAVDLLVSGLLYSLTIVPALLIVSVTPHARRTALVLVAAPFGLLVCDLLLALGQLSRPLLFALCVDIAVALGAALVDRVPARALAGTALACFVVTVGVRAIPRGGALADIRGPSVLLVVLDTTSARHLSAYGYDRETSPNLDALARRSLVYRRAISPAPWTIPAHASIFSGRYPSELGFNGFGFIRSDAGSIAADLVRAGRPAFGIAANPILFSHTMFSAGFDALWGARRLTQPFLSRLVDAFSIGRSVLPRGDRVTDLALDWIDRIAPRGEPWFLFLNYIDPHTPYDPPRAEHARFAPGIDPARVESVDYASGRRTPPPDGIAAMRALYDAEIAAVDRALGRLLQGLARRGFDDTNLLLVVTADHGEAFGEQGVFGHMRGLPDAVLHVPLFIAGPGIVPGVVNEPVQTIQLRATIRRLLGLPDIPCVAPQLPPWGTSPSLIVSERQAISFVGTRDDDPWLGDWFAVERDGLKAVFDGQGHGVTYHLRDDPDELGPLTLDDAAALVRDYQTWRRAMCPIRLEPTT